MFHCRLRQQTFATNIRPAPDVLCPALPGFSKSLREYGGPYINHPAVFGIIRPRSLPKTLTVLSQRVCASAPGQANELAGIRLRRQTAHRARTLPSAWPAPSISPVWPVRTRSSGSGLPAMPVNWRSFGKTPGRPRANGLARPSTATTSRLKTLWGCGLLVLSDRMTMKAAFRAT